MGEVNASSSVPNVGNSSALARTVSWNIASQRHPRETSMGDGAVCQPIEGGWLIVAVDGLGHGPAAEHATQVACKTIAARASTDLVALVQHSHEMLRPTRGVVLAAATFATNGLLTWLGVGNVEGLVMRLEQNRWRITNRLTPTGGVVGYQLPKLQMRTLRPLDDEVVVFHTDGVEANFTRSLLPIAPALMPDEIIRRFARSDDDALVIAARYVTQSALE